MEFGARESDVHPAHKLPNCMKLLRAGCLAHTYFTDSFPKYPPLAPLGRQKLG